MKRFALLILTIPMLTLTGCDFFRTLAGRPTSKDIEKKQVSVLLKEKEALVTEKNELEARYETLARELQIGRAHV